MTVATDITAQRAETLRGLHRGSGLLVLPNAWDAASAKVVEAAGFTAIATTSGGVSQVLGYADGEHAPVEEMLAAAGRIISSINLPVTVDFESGYQLSPEDIVHKLIAIGAAGMNIEDTDHRPATPGLLDPEQNAERLAAIKAAGKAEGVDLVLNARVDVFVRRIGSPEEQLADGLRRAKLYLEAGADCIYPILLADEAAIDQIVKAVGVVNINVRRGGPISLAKAASLGVRRVSYATSIFRELTTSLEQIVADIGTEARL